MNQSAVKQKYDISKSEMSELERAIDRFFSALRSSVSKNIPTLDELRKLEQTYSEKQKYEADTAAAEKAHSQKKQLHRLVTSPKRVERPSTYDLDRALKKLSEARRAENELAYLCRAHGFDIAEVVRDFIPTARYSETLADAYRSYVHCKSKPLFRAVPA